MALLQDAELGELVAEFDKTGVIVLPLLSEAEVAALRDAFDDDRRSFPALWTLRGTDSRGGPTGESGRWQSGEVLRTSTAAFAPVVSHPRVLQLAAALIGDSARHGGCSAMWREPVPDPPPADVPAAYREQGIHWQLWHRESGGTTSPDHPRVIPSLQVIVLLDDCDEESHCFSVVKESVEDKLALPTEEVDGGKLRVRLGSLTGAKGMWENRPLAGRPGWEERDTGTNIHAPAGTVIIQNNLNIHAGTVRTSERPRRTIHLIFSNTGGKWRYGEAGEAVDSVDAAEAAAGPAAAEFFASVPLEWRWMFDARSLQASFTTPDERPDFEKRYTAVVSGEAASKL